jgi:surfactin synthase thioesterase subunit
VTNAIDSIWLQRLAPRPQAKARLFCFPYAGAGASVYRRWASEASEDLEVCAVQLPGRGHRLREPPLNGMADIVQALVEALSPHLGGRFAFFGHSMGAVVAYELARALASAGRSPLHLFLSGRRPPRIPDPAAPLRFLDDKAFVAEIVHRYGGIPPEVLQEPDVLALLLPCLRADIAALETHQPGVARPLDVPISVYGGSEDRLTPIDHLHAWRSATTGAFRSRTFPGGHFYLEAQRQGLLADLAASLAPALADAHREGTTA